MERRVISPTPWGDRVSRSFSELCEPVAFIRCILGGGRHEEHEEEREREWRTDYSSVCRYIDKVGVGSRKDKSVGRGYVQLARSAALAASSDVERL